MIIWINGGFGAGKTTLAGELHRRLPDALVYDLPTAPYQRRAAMPRLDSQVTGDLKVEA